MAVLLPPDWTSVPEDNSVLGAAMRRLRRPSPDVATPLDLNSSVELPRARSLC